MSVKTSYAVPCMHADPTRVYDPDSCIMEFFEDEMAARKRASLMYGVYAILDGDEYTVMLTRRHEVIGLLMQTAIVRIAQEIGGRA